MNVLLKDVNKHLRDDRIKFEESTHTYTIDGQNDYISATTLIHSYFPHFNADLVIEKMKNSKNWNADNKYYNMTNDEIKNQWSITGKEASRQGTLMHLNIENYYNGLEFTNGFKDTHEYKLFKEYLKDHEEYKAYRTEWTIFTTKYKVAGSVDMLYIDPKDSEKLIIADWKRSKEIKFSNKWESGNKPLEHLDNCNFIHYSLQLNLYRMIIEKYYDKKISEMFLVILHPNLQKYQKIIIPKMSKEISDILKNRLLAFKK